MKRNLLTVVLAFFVVSGMFAQKATTTFDADPNPSNKVIDGEKAQWDVDFTFDALVAGCPGIETDGTNFYTTLWSGSDFHRYDMDGSNGTTFTVAGAADVRDMAYDGTYFYGAAADMNLFQMDLAGETLVSTITAVCTGVTGIRHIAYDPELDSGNGGFWIGNWSELGAIAMDGSELIANIVGISSSAYGSAYDAYTDPANPKLWIFMQPASNAIFTEFDINTQTLTGVTHDAADAPGYDAGISGGACSYVDELDQFILVGNIQQDPNLVVGYELAIDADPLAPGEATGFTGVADAGGALTVNLDWTNPALDLNGAALAELTSVDVYLSTDLMTPIYTNASPTIGGADSYVATVATGGTNTFIVRGTNSAGQGAPVVIDVFVGFDVSVSDIDIPVSAVVDDVISPSVEVTGLGVGSLSFDLTLVINDGTTDVYTEVVAVSALVIGTPQDIVFPDWTATPAGTYTFTATAADPGGDVNLANNEMVAYLNVFGGCEHTLDLADSYGDGWNGNTCSVTVEGIVALDHVTVASGSAAAFSFYADDGDAIQFDFWGEGSYLSECSWIMEDGLGVEMFSGSAPTGPVTENVTGICSVSGYDVTFNVNMADSIASGYFIEGTDQLWVAGTMNSWTIPGDDAAYEMTESGTDDIYTVTVALADATYEYKYFKIVGGVSSWDNGEWPETDNRSFTHAGADLILNDIYGQRPVSVEELNLKGINVYPNPSSGVFNISVENNFNLEVLDITGKVINTQVLKGNSTINIDNAGLYFFRFSNEEGSVTQRVVVQ